MYISRHETLFGKLTLIQDHSHLIREREIDSEVKIFKIKDLIQENGIFIGFGKPNVFLGYEDKGTIYKYDAKSLKRKKSKVVDTRGWAQSGIIVNIKNPTKKMRESLIFSAKSFEGKSHWTCVNSTGRVLNRAGFTSGGKDFSDFYLPMNLAKQIFEHGIEFRGKKIELDIIKTKQDYLESFGFSVIQAQWSTGYRHFKRFYHSKSKKYTILKGANKLKHKIKNSLIKKSKIVEAEEFVTMYPENKPSRKNIELTITMPSKIGVVFRQLCGPHAFYEIKHSKSNIDKLLPKSLKEYALKENGFFTKIKKNVLFSKPVVSFIRSHLADTKESFNDCSESELYNMIRTNTSSIPNKYNLIITSESVYVIKIGIKYKFVDWILSKHVLLSGYSDDVRYAGEFWKNANGIIYFNNNSGTYAPNSELLEPAKLILKSIFPNTKIKIKPMTKQ